MIDFDRTDYENIKNNKLKRMADYWQRQYLLSNSRKNGIGNVFCPLTKAYYRPNRVHASHFVDRGRMCTRYHDDNVWLISAYSNTRDAKVMIEGDYKSKHHKEYEEFLLNKIGRKKLDNLLELSHNNCIFGAEEYIGHIERFRNGI